MAGVVTAHYLSPSAFYQFVWCALGCLCLLITLKWNYRYMLIVALIAGAVIGLWRGSIDQAGRIKFEPFIGQAVEVTGKLKRDVDVDARGSLRLQLTNPVINQQPLTGIIWASTANNDQIERGDIVTVQGNLAEGFGMYSATMYRAKTIKSQRPTPGDIAGRLRDKFASAVRKVIPEPQSSLGLGYLVGQRRYLPIELDDALRVAGLTHVVVASGFHLSTIVRFARRLFEKLSRFLATAVTSAVMLCFVAVTGLSPSMTRASLVTAFSLLAWYYGRKFHPLVLLPLVAAITVLVTPSYIWGSMGWQLSFAAFAGVMILAPLVQRYFFGDKRPGTIRQLLGETISAQLATWPILVYGFGQFSTLATVSNILILPFVPLAMLLTFIAGIIQLFVPFAAVIFALPASWLLGYMIATVEYIASLPFAMQELKISIWWAVVAYLALVLACFYMWYRTKFSLRDTNIVE